MTKDITSLQIGVLGGGQLGRMMIQAGIDLNLDIAVMDPNPEAPCAHLVKDFIAGDITNAASVYDFGKDKDLVTIEIENVSVEGLKKLQSEGVKVYPQPEIIELIQDKRKQKTFYKANRIPTAEFILTENKQQVFDRADFLPAVNKLGKEGYDGRGVEILRGKNDLDRAFDKPGLLEKLIDFDKEISVIVARNEAGEVQTFPVVEMSYHPTANLVEFLFSPADISSESEQKAREVAVDVMNKLNMVGILAVELFLTHDGDILVNEVAPRTHNSGHHTIEGNITSQFEQHLRAILGLPMGATDIIVPAAMVNLLGEEGYSGEAKYEGMKEVLAIEGVHVHLYGKKLTKPFRKMGHVTITHKDMNKLKERAMKVKTLLKVKA